MDYLLFGAYLFLFAWLVTRVKFFHKSGLSRAQLLILFLLKIMAGILYGWIGIYYGKMAQMVDTWGFHYYSLQEYKLLQTHPRQYLTNIFYNPYEDGFYTFFSSDHSFWQNLKGNAMIKLLSVFDIFTFGNYYSNIIFYDFLTFFGSIGLYRVMTDLFPGRKKVLIFGVFLIPSFLFWSNGIHKEGLIFTGLSLIVYHTYFSLAAKRFSTRAITGIIGGFFIVFVFRNFLLFTILPAWLAWLLAGRFQSAAWKVFATVYMVSGLLFFGSRYLSTKLDFPAIVVTKQQDFLRLQGGSSQIAVRELEPRAWSFLRSLPLALTDAALRPFPRDARNFLSVAASVEVLLFLAIFALFLLRRAPGPPDKAVLYYFLFFSGFTLLVIGYTVNFLGAIVRYRSVILPFYLCPLLALTDWAGLKTLVFPKKQSA